MSLSTLSWTEENASTVAAWNLRGSYQARAIDSLLAARRGICVAPARSGKTIIAARALHAVLLEWQESRPLTVLWIANTVDQLDQARSALSLLKEFKGRVRGFIRTPSGLQGVPFDEIDVLVVDECHHAAAETWRAAIENCISTTYRWGLTATPHREDGEWLVVERIIGPVCCHIQRQEVQAQGFTAHGIVRFICPNRENEYQEPVRAAVFDPEEPGKPSRFHATLNKMMWQVRKGVVDEQELTTKIERQVTQQQVMALAIAENEKRNRAAAEICREHQDEGQSCLCLVYSVAQGDAIAAMVPGAVLVHSKLGKKVRTAAIDGFRTGTIKTLVATSLADEGLDVPIASVLVMAAGGRGISKQADTAGKTRHSSRIEQRTARVLTKFDGKQCGLIYDFYDHGHVFSRASSWTRFKGYKLLGFEIERCPEMFGGAR
jgi:superfamily II DNA or RNA helicase